MDPRRLALIRSGDAERHTVGSGYLIAPRLVLTARHVLIDRATTKFWPKINVYVGHERDGEQIKTSAQRLWEHPSGLDIALLQLAEEIDLPDPVRWGRPEGRAPLPYEGLGYPWASKNGQLRAPEHLRGFLPVLSGGKDRYVLDQTPAPAPRVGGNAWGGASGAAIFCGDHLVCVVTEEDQAYGARRLIAVPVSSFATDDTFTAHIGARPQLAPIGAPLPKAEPGAERTPAERELEKLLRPLFPDAATRTEHGKELAHQLGYDTAGYAPCAADLVTLALTHPRALATLSETLAQKQNATNRTALTTLLTTTRTLAYGALLSLNEYDDLLTLLRSRDNDPTLIPRAAREALRYAVLPEALNQPRLDEAQLADAIAELENLSDKGAPALLKVVEYIAAATEQRDDLRTWSKAVADRLGVHQDVLAEHRAEAERWAKRPASPVSRVVMSLERDEAAGEERYRCRILLVRDDGTHRVLKEVESVSKTPQEVASCLSEAVFAVREEPGQGDTVPWVTVEVDRDGLQRAVDEWVPGAVDDILPARPIGADYRVSLSCPEFRRRSEDDQKRRWRHGRQVTLVVDPACDSVHRLVHLLRTDHRDTARVVLHGPADQQKPWLLATLALGAPVVLWDRDAGGHEDAVRLVGLAPAGDLDGLPERVRHFRSDTAARWGERRARPSLVWEPEERHPRSESLLLADPARGTNAS
ncbi:trypsin-like peptidase domain-containing protein [Streptomyces acidiscabies]|uniref:Trypsin-like peptidase domain-containing protein n=1 Tax=Streptomyces acidiscabies TaxID=42234 RepID=A0AAP6BDY8_9ACTN|nr:trypsin-like peptidase domain-containing protein [Streptomyces acidiscabies]MBZ3913238.1 trypsin-like peptidase domain-containing protein [Streptomyces acidiscabies]MDX2962934.1 trypsin-like peptidase domain-containing protein [Streptomyces acidiscabies]MDX3021445.1 trypsin-like peptidase domain-containing protein [Streptomyces acidiscabies]MDX3790203.1 trypsin-like peptidase domain-containing protein [Streptomyces acidiscabies]GAQ53099.1 trypsin [Streptomyces acidiscabies]